MKRIILSIVLALSMLFAHSQVPKAFSYQAIIRDASGNVLSDKLVSFRISILTGSSIVSEIYSETHSVTTNDFGLANLKIGMGVNKTGVFMPGGWGIDSHYIKIAVDLSGGNSFLPLSTTELLAVPYAFHAQTVEEDNVEDADANPTNEIQSLSINDNELSLSDGGGTVTLPEQDPCMWTENGMDDIYRLGGKVGIDTDVPELKLSLKDDGGILAEGEIGVGTTLIKSGEGTRLIWYPKKASFRAGFVLSDNWDEVNIGEFSFASGANTKASGVASSAFGEQTLASGNASTSFGLFTKAESYVCTALGVGNVGGGSPDSWVNTDPLFEIGNSLDHQNPSNALTVLKNGNVGLTKVGFTKPHARFQVPENGNLDTGSGLDATQAAIYVGYDQNSGIAIDNDQIESINNTLKINSVIPTDITMVNGGGKVGIGTETPVTIFHVAEGKTVLIGNDTLGKTNFYPDAKLMFVPLKGGAFRVGQLNADGSIIGGTGYNFWDYSNIGWASVAIGNNTRATGAGSVALGIRADARNFGSVAIGHLSRTRGNSGIAAGYYTRADAFVSCAVGSCNVGGGQSNTWNNLDPIFEVGNSIDTTNRSNAFTVLKNGRVGINHANPQSMLDIEQPNAGPGNGVLLNLQGYGHWETFVDHSKDYNFYFNNSLKAYIRDTDGAFINTSDASLKTNIHDLEPVLNRVQNLRPKKYQYKDSKERHISTGFVAQEVETIFPEQVIIKDGLMGINYREFTIIAIKAIQEQQDLIESQETKIDLLEKRISALERENKK